MLLTFEQLSTNTLTDTILGILAFTSSIPVEVNSLSSAHHANQLVEKVLDAILQQHTMIGLVISKSISESTRQRNQLKTHMTRRAVLALIMTSNTTK